MTKRLTAQEWVEHVNQLENIIKTKSEGLAQAKRRTKKAEAERDKALRLAQEAIEENKELLHAAATRGYATDQQEPERLTVADLDNAPVGSKVTWPTGSYLEKGEYGDWLGVTAQDVIAAGDDFTLTYPDLTPVTAETIRASEVGSTWEDCDGDIWEWDGQGLHEQFSHGLGCSWYDLDGVIEHHGPLTRSTAAPRGDYGKAEVPEVVALAEVLGDFAVADEHDGSRNDLQLARLLVRRGVKVVTDE